MRIDIVTTLPEMITPALETSILKRASERGIVEFRVVNLRDYTHDRHRTTDDAPYAGGGGMVMKIEPITAALEDLLGSSTDEAQADTEDATPRCKPRVVLTDPRGQQWTQELAREWAQEAHIILLCGHYEGVDDRVRQHLVTDEVSIGDYVLTGGELPALVITDSLTRLQAGALGDSEAPNKDTFSGNLLEYPHFTRPREFRGWRVPDILLSGNHALIEKWRRWNQLRTTRERRPDLFAKLSLTAKDYALMEAEEPQAPVE